VGFDQDIFFPRTCNTIREGQACRTGQVVCVCVHAVCVHVYVCISHSAVCGSPLVPAGGHGAQFLPGAKVLQW